jgi:branched-chain amino acid transport system ATP-binding protein
MLELKGVSSGYGAIEALKSINISDRQRGDCYAYRSEWRREVDHAAQYHGPGYSDRGDVTFEGSRLNGKPTHEITALGISMVPEGRAIFSNLTVLENLEMGAYLQKDKARNAATFERVFGLFPRLKERRKQSGGTLSGGEQQMLAIGRALMAHPRLLLLDEPSLGLAPLLVHTIFGAIDAINKEGTTILLVEQNANAALRSLASSVCSRNWNHCDGRSVAAGRCRFPGKGRYLGE